MVKGEGGREPTSLTGIILQSVLILQLSPRETPQLCLPIREFLETNDPQQVSSILVGGGGEHTWVNFAGYVLLASQSPYPILVYSVANYRPRVSHFRGNLFCDPNLVTFCLCIYLKKKTFN